MDINSLEVVEKVLKEYDRTVLFVSHDRKFVDSVADTIMTIEDSKIKMFKGNYKEYIASSNVEVDTDKEEIEKKIFVLQNRLSEVLGRLSMPSKKDNIPALDREYYSILAELKKLKSRL